MKTIIRITNDYNGTLSYDNFKEYINYLVHEMDIFCEVKNNKFNNIVEDEKNYAGNKDDYSKQTIVNATGYSQNEWETYVLYHNLEEDDRNLISLVKQLKRSFTHFNDYQVEKFERTTIDGKDFDSEPHDYTCLCIDFIEFPEKKDIIKEYNEIYGVDYDEYIVEI